MAGRGRGRGRGAVPSAAPVKPGGGVSKDPIDQLDVMVRSLALDADDKDLLPIKETATKAATSAEKMEEIFRTVYQRCQEDWRFSPCAARVCCQLVSSGLEAEGAKFRNTLIGNIHTDFKNRDKLRTEAPQKCLGTLSFLCQIFGQMRDEKGDLFAPLSDSVMKSLEMLLDDKASDDEMWCATEQFYVVGRPLRLTVDKLPLTALRNKVKDKIIHAVGSKEVRTELIKVVEGFASEWKHYA